MRFWDASALVPLLVEEPRSASMRSLAQADPELVIWWASPVECTSALCRLVREQAFSAEQRQVASRLLDQVASSAAQVLPAEEVRERATRLLAVHPLRAADALQLAAALVWCRERPVGSGFVCQDDRLRQAASLEGFTVLP